MTGAIRSLADQGPRAQINVTLIVVALLLSLPMWAILTYVDMIDIKRRSDPQYVRFTLSPRICALILSPEA